MKMSSKRFSNLLNKGEVYVPKVGKPIRSFIQILRTKSQYKLVSSYLTKKGLKLFNEGKPEEILAKYRKNRYILEKESQPIMRQIGIKVLDNLKEIPIMKAKMIKH